MRLSTWLVVLSGLASACVGVHDVPWAMRTWNGRMEPFRIAGNVYFVGTNRMGIFLVTTPAGHVLIDSGFEANVPELERSVEKLGFHFEDIKVLLSSHAHIDHVQGHALVRQMTGARVVSSAEDAPVIESGGQHEWAYGSAFSWVPCPVDDLVKDGDRVLLGGSILVARLTPGHTRGAITWTTTVEEEGTSLAVVFYPSGNVPPAARLVKNPDYPRVASDFAHSFATWKALPCDVFLGSHGEFFDLEAKRRRMVNGVRPNPFIDPQGYRATIADAEQKFRAILESQGGSMEAALAAH
jgi:metallo-beta-lactamase class B